MRLSVVLRSTCTTYDILTRRACVSSSNSSFLYMYIFIFLSGCVLCGVMRDAHALMEHTRCTRSGLKQITCPSGLSFDVEKQTCDWKAKVTNCNQKESKFPPTTKKSTSIYQHQYTVYHINIFTHIKPSNTV